MTVSRKQKVSGRTCGTAGPRCDRPPLATDDPQCSKRGVGQHSPVGRGKRRPGLRSEHSRLPVLDSASQRLFKPSPVGDGSREPNSRPLVLPSNTRRHPFRHSQARKEDSGQPRQGAQLSTRQVPRKSPSSSRQPQSGPSRQTHPSFLRRHRLPGLQPPSRQSRGPTDASRAYRRPAARPGLHR